METKARLVVRIGAQHDQDYTLTQDVTIIGREGINDLIINDAEVSRRHCRVIRKENQYTIEDLGSTNGTFLNSQRVTTATLLYHGDTLELGKTVTMIFLNQQGSAEAGQESPVADPLENAPIDESFYLHERADPSPPPPESAEPETPEEEIAERQYQRYFFSCGCIALLLFFLIGTTIFVLDRTSPQLLYCGPLEGVWKLFMQPLLSLFDKTWDCSVLLGP